MGGVEFPDVEFPTPVTFDTFGGPGSREAAAKVLEEAAEFVESAKRYERRAHRRDGEARAEALGEAMDVYQAVANFVGNLGGYGATFGEDEDRPCLGKETAMGVLCAAAVLFADRSRENADDVLWNLAFALWGEFTSWEILAAYGNCRARNRRRGRI